jgi:hypothetical protein
MNKVGLVLLGVLLSAKAAYAQDSSVDLATQTGNNLGLTISGYQYKEPSLSVTINAPLVGLDYTGTYAFGNDWFAKADARFAYGTAKYTGSGTQSNIPYSYYDLRGLFGYDFSFSELGSFVLAPYSGIGYRYLFDNQSGQTTAGTNSYQRTSTYVYLPIGVTHHMKVNDVHKLETTFEYDYLIQGTQVSNLSQAVSYLPNVTNQQNHGYGLRLSSMYQFDTWSVGPYVTYWNIAQSNSVISPVIVNGKASTITAYEPANTTIELGLKLAYAF